MKMKGLREIRKYWSLNDLRTFVKAAAEEMTDPIRKVGQWASVRSEVGSQKKRREKKKSNGKTFHA